jgi:HPt (histidine-containing phosphotransfer) domain-containing protein
MKRIPRLSVLVVLLAATAVAAAEMRTWNLKSGATLEAEIVAFPGPDTVKVKRSDGKLYTLPAAYLGAADRAYLQTERAKQWKEVSVDKLLGTMGRYKKCAVSGKDVWGDILVALLPSQAEAVLNNRQQQEAQIADLNSQIQNDSNVARDAHTAATSQGSGGYRRANRAQARLATRDEADAKISVEKLKTDYAEYVKKTKTTTTLLLRNTGLVSEGLPVWECQASPKRQ